MRGSAQWPTSSLARARLPSAPPLTRSELLVENPGCGAVTRPKKTTTNDIAIPRQMVHTVIPLSILEALRSSDAPDGGGVDELSTELASKRLGMSPTIAAQIARYRRLFRRGARADADEVAGLLRLVERRPDASAVVRDAGRRAARHAAPVLGKRVARPLHGVPLVGAPLCLAIARRAAARFLDLDVDRADGEPVATAGAAAGAPIGPLVCGLYEAAFEELLRVLTDFDGSVIHVNCRARGDVMCQWRARPSGPGA